MTGEPLWTCPNCVRTFAARNQTHTCAPLGTLEAHFTNKDPQVKATFDHLLSVVSTFGPFTVLPEKTRIALHARMSFAVFMPRRHWLSGHLVLPRQSFRRIETYSPHNVLHTLRLAAPSDIDAELSSLLKDAYSVGCQYHRGGVTGPW